MEPGRPSRHLIAATFAIALAVLLSAGWSARAEISFGDVKRLAPDDPYRAAIAARTDADPVLLFDPPMLDFGDIAVGQLASRTIRVINALGQPINVKLAVASGSSLGARNAPGVLQPEEWVAFTIDFSPPEVQGIDLRKRITFMIEGHPPVVYDFVGHTMEVIRVLPRFVTAPSEAELVRAARHGPTLPLESLLPGNAYDVRVQMTNDSDEPRVVRAIESDAHAVPGWVDGDPRLEAGETRIVHLPFMAPRVARPYQTVVEGWTIHFDDGSEEAMQLSADLSPRRALLLESDVIELGELRPETRHVVPVTLVNVSGRPLRVTKVILSGSSVVPSWPVEPIAPLKAFTLSLAVGAPSAVATPLTIQRICTIQLDGAPPQTITLRGTVPAAEGEPTTSRP